MTERNGMTVHGYIVKPHAGRAKPFHAALFVNGRYVKSRLMQAAMEEAYRNAIITGKYPSGALFLDLPLSAVDVNAHPAKTEVNFAGKADFRGCVYCLQECTCRKRQYAASGAQGKGSACQAARR
ncbi:MAG: hypothetical protein ACLRVN_01785 [Butyricicoccus sp.]